jgi:oxygen-dependent protoporphyrinogen oxidase
VLVESWVHEQRAPAGCHLLRVLIGGALDGDAVALPDDELYERAARAVRAGLGVTAPLGRFGIVRHTPGIPQYEVGHLARLEKIGDRLARLPGLLLTGWGYRGIGANAVIADAVAIAGRLRPRARGEAGGGA